MLFWEILLLRDRCHLFRKKIIPAPRDEMLIFIPFLLLGGEMWKKQPAWEIYYCSGVMTAWQWASWLLLMSCRGGFCWNALVHWTAHGQACSLAGEIGRERYRGCGSIILCFCYKTRVWCQVCLCIALGETMHAHIKEDFIHISRKLPPDD